MSQQPQGTARYGVDAPAVIRNLALGGVACMVLGGVLFRLLSDGLTWLGTILLIFGLATGVSYLLTAGLMLRSSLSGKSHTLDRLVNSLNLRGDENVLDMGCGRGILMNKVAKHLPSGKVVGLDLWQKADQSGNSPEATLANARAEGVADRVEIRTGDMRRMPFPGNTFDVVVSSLAIHNIADKEGREQAVGEVALVLKPGGRAALLDFQKTEEYAATLEGLGWQDVTRSGTIYSMFPPVRVVTGTKPLDR